MGYIRGVLVLGIVLVILPFAGVPGSTEKVVSIVVGIALAGLSFGLYRRFIFVKGTHGVSADTFTENGAPRAGASAVPDTTSPNVPPR